MAERAVITGMGAVTPIGNDVETMWQSMSKGVHGIARITRFDFTNIGVSLAAETKDFDPLLYASKRDLQRCDLYTLFALGAAEQAMDDSSISGTVDPYRMGVYFGTCMGGIATSESGCNILFSQGSDHVPPYSVPALIPNSAAAMIAIKYSLHGACLALTTACAAGANSIGEAYRAVRDGYADAILAGGSDASVTPFGISGFNACRALSRTSDPDRASIPFDAERSGFVMGEGAGALVVESYTHAKKRGAKIYAEILGYGTTCDAFHITRPAAFGDCASEAIKQALSDISFDPERVYVNAHGTSTILNDEIETLAIKKAFGEENAKKLLVSSTKSMTGHLLGAAAAVESIAAIKALASSLVPPTVGYKTPDPACDLNICPNTAVKRELDFSVTNSIGFGGHNACLVFGKV